MHRHCGTNNRAPRWTFTDPCKPEVRPGAREESASPAWLAAPAMNVRDTTKVYIWRIDTGCGPTLYRKCHSHNTPGIFVFLFIHIYVVQVPDWVSYTSYRSVCTEEWCHAWRQKNTKVSLSVFTIHNMKCWWYVLGLNIFFSTFSLRLYM